MDRFSSVRGLNRVRTRQVTKQGVFYIVGFLVMYIPFWVAAAASLWPGEPPLPRGYYGKLCNTSCSFCYENEY